MALIGRGFSMEEVTSAAASLLGGLGRGRTYLAKTGDVEVGNLEEIYLAEGGTVLAKVLGVDTISQPHRARVERVDTGEVLTVPVAEEEIAPSCGSPQKFGSGGKTLLDSRNTTIFQDYEDSFKLVNAQAEVGSCSPSKDRRRRGSHKQDIAPLPEERPAEPPAEEVAAEEPSEGDPEEQRDALSPMRPKLSTPAATTPSAVPPRSFSLDDSDEQPVYPMAPRSFSVDAALLPGAAEDPLQDGAAALPLEGPSQKPLDDSGLQRHQPGRRQRRHSARFPAVEEASEPAATKSRPRRMSAAPSRPSEGAGAWESFGLTNLLGPKDGLMSRVATALNAGGTALDNLSVAGASAWDSLRLLGGGDAGGQGGEGELKRATPTECTLPVDISFALPESLQPGQRSVCIRGPHGPICVQLHDGAAPGESMQVRIGPKTSYRVAVPEGASPGETMAVQLPDGVQIQTIVPPGKQPGEQFDLSPPCLMVHVPKGLGPGDEVAFTAPDGRAMTATVPQELVLGQYFEVPC